MPKDWLIAAPWPQRDGLAAALNVSPVVAQVLLNREITDPALARQFLKPQLTDLHPPESIPNVPQAAERIAAAIAAQKKIVLFGDYDVDGITGVAILWQCLRLAGANVDFYIPHRLEEGYGINTAALESLAADGANMVITVDCGVTAVEPAARARQLGLELIITDHHHPRTKQDGSLDLPDALIVHPGLTAGQLPPLARGGTGGSSDTAAYPNPNLSGAGVALKLAWALAQRISGSTKVTQEFRDFLIDAVGLAALGIVADVVPLTGENRILAHFGLRSLPESRSPGLQALIHSAGLDGKPVGSYDVGFKLAPRLNAIGRMGHARLAVEMLTRAAADEAKQIAANLEQQNRARQTLERRIAAEARAMVFEQKQDSDACRAVVLARDGWHAGVIGIVASRITEEFGRPTVLIALENGAGQGSARSIRNFHLHEQLTLCREHLTTFGGHAMAAGLRISADKVDAFRDAFQARAGQCLTAADLRPRLRIDDVVRLRDLDERLVSDLARLEPFGPGNPPARLCTEWLDVVGDPRTVGGGGDHLQVVLAENGQQRKGIAFGMAKLRPQLMDHRRCRVAFSPMINEWQGRRTVEMQIHDFQFPDQ